MPTPQKVEAVKDLVEKFRAAKSLTFADYRGLDVALMTELRRRCRESGVRFHVTKNTLSRLAVAEMGLADAGPILEGPTGIAFAEGDELAGARVLADFAKEHETLQLKGGLLEGRFYDLEEVAALASLPPREQLLALLLSAMESPVTELIGIADSLVQDVLSCAEQVPEGKGEPEPAAAAEESEQMAEGKGEPEPAAAAEESEQVPESGEPASGEDRGGGADGEDKGGA